MSGSHGRRGALAVVRNAFASALVSVLVSVLVTVLAVAMAAATAVVAGAGHARAADGEVRDETQAYAHVPLRAQEPYASTPEWLVLDFAYDGPQRPAELSVDASGIEGVAVVERGADGCRPRMPSFGCELPLQSDDVALNSQEFLLSPAAGAEAGDRGTLRYVLRPEGLPAVRGSVTVIAGRPELRVNEGATLAGSRAGDALDVPVTVRNTGDVPARGVVLVMDGDGDLSATTRHSNCRYSRDASIVQCLLPDAVIAPGETLRVTPTPRVRSSDDALDERLSYGAWAFHTHGRHPGSPCCVDDPDPALTPGDAEPLALAPDPEGGAGTTFTPDREPAEAEVPVRNAADVEAIGASFRGGEVGSSHRVRVGFRNNGPAETGEIRTVFVVPAGTEVTEAPYDPEAEAEMLDQVCQTEDEGRSYVCRQHADVGQEVRYAFTLRVTRAGGAPGCVSVSAWNGPVGSDSERVRDPRSGNDTAVVEAAGEGGSACAVAEAWETGAGGANGAGGEGSEDGGGDGGGGGWAVGVGVLVLLGVALPAAVVVVRRRRATAP
ncbi:hypothetical protein ACTWP5_21155 [Streptomyces sp. 4N509B]|uniref:hypothetical protein n=1 Tax=Streptomyces sp. 4N509B TaxID=3457413 RepID=UPI003FD30526